MKRPLFSIRPVPPEPKEVIVDLRDTLGDILGPAWELLGTPVILDIDIVDLLVRHESGRLGIITVLGMKDQTSVVGTILTHYQMLSGKLEKLARAYPDKHIDTNERPVLKVFVPVSQEAFTNLIGSVSIPLEVYSYCFVEAPGGTCGLVVEKTGSAAEHASVHDYAAMVTIMGENVRSEHSAATIVPETVQPCPSEVTDRGIQPVTTASVVVAKEPASEPPAPSVPAPTEAVTLPAVCDEKGATVFDETRLSEEELVAFFDFEQRLQQRV